MIYSCSLLRTTMYLLHAWEVENIVMHDTISWSATTYGSFLSADTLLHLGYLDLVQKFVVRVGSTTDSAVLDATRRIRGGSCARRVDG